MCGICGWIDFNNNISNNSKILKDMTDSLKLRGPDSYGYYITQNIMLGHRRLIVVDPSGGIQPMTKILSNKKYTIVYNGELYNTEDLRKELISKGFKFEGYSDTEILLTSYIYWKESFLEKLNGIFAFCIFDEYEQKLILARDPLGIKPLFYSIKNSSFIFGSEIKTLLKHPYISTTVDKTGLSELFALGPATSPGNAIFKDINEIPPGHCAIISKSSIQLKEYWKLKVYDFNETIEQAEEHLKFLVSDSICRQLVGDVPLCTFLSGGLDSSAISAIVSNEFKKSNKKLTTYSIEYEDNTNYFESSMFQPDSDEYWTKKMVDFIKSNHKTILINNIDLANYLKQAVISRDLPGMADIDSSLYLACKEISNDFVIALSGECADELFGGYPWYTDESMIYSDTFPWSRFAKDRYHILNDSLSNINIQENIDYYYKKSISEVPHQIGEDKLTYRMRELFYLNIKWFMVNLLNRKDRMSMSNSLEVRVPFADIRLVDYAFNIPPNIKFVNGREKGLLRNSLKGILPKDIIYRKKSPYPKTFNPIYTDTVCKTLNSIINSKTSPILNIINKQNVQNIIDTKGTSYKTPWFGQLMTGPQLIAYLIQVNIWLEEYNINLLI
ncbi:asparagine synthase (glutamine-hydrolysing) [Clostridium cavendishii DSM 21758]|uniref:asparagine synthase (glutamine-hydrolyzing) n=1 Tax=Clostridium cavendishii DSM 21758 TaxID=1121302 RepID=A0A1M6VRG2_9CLOT|nr:asparagine synthase (glutamine-hydrolyzing) [Clostridium cavendishii]SHK83816.1 asparagine synthase (glutamine-hydrolysing) [Clostridium cavendishii DSM 21758]